MHISRTCHVRVSIMADKYFFLLAPTFTNNMTYFVKKKNTLYCYRHQSNECTVSIISNKLLECNPYANT